MSRASSQEGEPWSTIARFSIGLDVSKDSHAVAVAEGGRDGEVRYFGEIASDAAAVRRFVHKLERPGARLRFCYEAGPTGYGLKRLIEGLGHDCAVIAPSLIPRRPGERVKTNRRDAVKLVRLFRAGELTEIWTPDEAHEAMRDLVRAREAAVRDRTRKRQEIRSFLLRHGRVYAGKKAWGPRHMAWLHELSFDWPAQKVVLHEMIAAESQVSRARGAAGRSDRETPCSTGRWLKRWTAFRRCAASAWSRRSPSWWRSATSVASSIPGG